MCRSLRNLRLSMVTLFGTLSVDACVNIPGDQVDCTVFVCADKARTSMRNWKLVSRPCSPK